MACTYTDDVNYDDIYVANRTVFYILFCSRDGVILVSYNLIKLKPHISK